MHYVWSFFTEKKNFSFLVLSSLVLLGLFAVTSIQKESNPEVKVPIGIVSTSLPGASAADVETLITDELESALVGSLENVNDITSISSNGVSSITVEFNANADLDKSIQDLKDKVDAVVPELPDDATDPYVAQIDFSQDPVVTFAVSGDLPPSEFSKLGNRLEDELKNIPGVSGVSIAGGRDREVHVVANAEALSSFGLSITSLTSAIRSANATLPIGNIEFGGVEYNVQFDAEINATEEIGGVVVATNAAGPIYVRDVAFVSDGLSDKTTLSRVSVDGIPSLPALTFNVRKQTGGNVTEITSAVNARLVELQSSGELLEGLDVLTIFDTGDLLIQDLLALSQSGFMAVLLVMGILLLTIGWRESLVAGLSIPLSFMIAFVGLLFSGNTLNFVSLFALILSVGILVDSAIVVVENIHSNMKQWMDKKEAALTTIREFHTPVTAGTMTTVAVFVPLFFISGIVGEFIKSIPFTVISVLLASLVVALGFIPLIASLMLRRRTTSRLEEQQQKYTKLILDWYKQKLKLVLGHTRRENAFIAIVIGLFFSVFVLPVKGIPAAVLFFAIVTIALFFLLNKSVRWLFFIPGVLVALVIAITTTVFMPRLMTMQVEFFPAGDEDYLVVEMELPQGTVLAKSELESRKIEEILYTVDDIESFVMTVGASSPYSGTGGSNNTKFANAFVQLREDREHTSQALADILTDELAVIDTSEIRVTQLANGPPVGTPIVISFRGNDLAVLEQLAVEASRILRDIDGTSAVTTSTKNDNTEFVLTIDKAKAASLGIDPSALALILRTAIEGTEATTIHLPGEDVDVTVKQALNRNYLDVYGTNQVTVDTIVNTQIETPQGPVLLSSVLNTSLKKGNTSIRHDDEERVATAQSELAENGNVALINQEFARQAESKLTIPEGVQMIIGGENEETDQSFAEMGYAIIAGLMLMFAIIVLMFNSFRHAIYVIAPAFFSFIGISIGLTITGNALSFPSLMGLIALVGIVVNNSIILIDVMNKRRIANPTEPIKDTVLEGASSRLRPILLTTITTVIGIIPLLFASSLWAPLALSIIFGLSFSVIITLLFIPVIYLRNPGTIE